MPLSNNEKSARHRAKVNADPAARARYLAKRRESYQRRKREGKTKHPAVAELSQERQVELRHKWRHYQRSHRNKIRSLPLQSCSQDEMNAQWLQDFAPYSPSSELEQDSPASSWVKQEPEPEIIQWELVNAPPADGNTEDNTPSCAVSTVDPSLEGLPSAVMLTITRLQCLLESRQERVEALERQVQDLMEDRRFLRSQIEKLTGARLLPVPEASTSVSSEPRSRKRRQKSWFEDDESITDESSSSSSSEESSRIRKKRRHRRRGKRGCVSQCD